MGRDSMGASLRGMGRGSAGAGARLWGWGRSDGAQPALGVINKSK